MVRRSGEGERRCSSAEEFHRGASEPLEGSAQQTDFGALADSAAVNGGITIVAPPPF